MKESLKGRKQTPPTPAEIVSETKKEKEVVVPAEPNSPTKEETEKKKSNAGHKKIADNKKKKQMVLTLTPDTYNRLMEWAETKARTAPNYVSEFVEEHIDDIMK